MTVSYTESCLIWNVPNGAFPHLASSIHQPTIPSGIVILAIDKCTTDVKKIIKKVSAEVAEQPLPKSAAHLQTATSPSQASGSPPSALPGSPLARVWGGTRNYQKFRPCAPQSSYFWFRVSRMTDFRSVQILINFLVHFFPQTSQHRFPPVLS